MGGGGSGEHSINHLLEGRVDGYGVARVGGGCRLRLGSAIASTGSGDGQAQGGVEAD